MSAPFMQLYVADYLGDTRHLTTEQHGAYLLLLMTMWRSDGVLPKDDAKLARIAGVTVSRWRRISEEVLAFFDDCEGGITQARLAAELAISDEKSEKRSLAGKAGGRAKALKDKKTAVANAMPRPCHSPEPEPSLEAKASSERASLAKPRRQSGSRFVPAEFAPTPDHFAKAEALGLAPGEMERTLARFRNHEFPRAYTDWNRCFHNWLDREKPNDRPANDRQSSTPRDDRLRRMLAGAVAAVEPPERDIHGGC